MEMRVYIVRAGEDPFADEYCNDGQILGVYARKKDAEKRCKEAMKDEYCNWNLTYDFTEENGDYDRDLEPWIDERVVQ